VVVHSMYTLLAFEEPSREDTGRQGDGVMGHLIDVITSAFVICPLLRVGQFHRMTQAEDSVARASPARQSLLEVSLPY